MDHLLDLLNLLRSLAVVTVAVGIFVVEFLVVVVVEVEVEEVVVVIVVDFVGLEKNMCKEANIAKDLADWDTSNKQFRSNQKQLFHVEQLEQEVVVVIAVAALAIVVVVVEMVEVIAVTACIDNSGKYY